MSYEYYNPHSCALDCTLPPPYRTIRVMPNESLPTPEQEKAGLNAELLKQFEVPNLLHRTPPAVRRRLFQANDIAIPKDLITATSHLAEFGGDIPAPSKAFDARNIRPSETPLSEMRKPRGTAKHVYPERSAPKLPSSAPSLDEVAQSLTLSSKIKKPVENP